MFGLFKKKKVDPQHGMNYFSDVEKPSQELNLIAKLIMHKLDKHNPKYTIDKIQSDHYAYAEQSLMIQKIASIAQLWAYAFLKAPLFKDEIHFGIAGFMIGSMSIHYIDFDSDETMDIFTPEQEELIFFIVDKYAEKSLESIIAEELDMDVCQEHIVNTIGQYSPQHMKKYFNNNVPTIVPVEKGSQYILAQAERIRQLIEEENQ